VIDRINQLAGLSGTLPPATLPIPSLEDTAAAPSETETHLKDPAPTVQSPPENPTKASTQSQDGSSSSSSSSSSANQQPQNRPLFWDFLVSNFPLFFLCQWILYWICVDLGSVGAAIY
jgi:hypothetical protein